MPKLEISNNIIRIAVVEDDEGVRQTFVRILESDGYEVIAFDSGYAFLNESPSYAFHCIVLDLEMPGADGATVLEKLKDSNNPPPVIVVTGTVNAGLLAAAASDPCVAILSKPVSVEELLGAVKDSLA